MKRLDDQSGFTIVELLMALVFFSFILIFATASFIQINRSYVRGANVKLVQEQTRRVVAEISDAIRQAGSDVIIIQDDDNILECNPTNTNVNDERQCVRRLCVGNVRFAWNQTVKIPNRSEHSHYFFSADGVAALSVEDQEAATAVFGEGITTDGFTFPYNVVLDDQPTPFGMLKSTSPGSDEASCTDRMMFLESTDLIDSRRVMVQDIDINEIGPGTYKIKVSLSTISTDLDETDLDYQTVLTDNIGETYNELRADRCKTDQVSLAFCYVETLSTIVTVR